MPSRPDKTSKVPDSSISIVCTCAFSNLFFPSDTEQTSAKGRYAIELWHKCRHILKKRIALLDKIFRNHEKYSYGSRVSVLTTEFKYR